MGQNVIDPRVAVVGTGYWGKNHVRNMAELGALGAICDSDEERLAEVGTQLAEPVVAYTSYEDLLSDASIDAVVLATPAVSHDRMAIEAMEAGKDVLVEKPLALSTAAGEKVVAVAEDLGRVLMVGHLLWYHPAVLELDRLIRSGELGKIRYIYSNRLNFGRFRVEENILWSFAPHDISVILGLLDEMPTEVDARGGTYLSSGVADVTVSTMAFPSGARAHVFVSWLHPFKEQRLVAVGEDGMATFQDSAEEGPQLLLYPHRVDWTNSPPVPAKAAAQVVDLPDVEPLRAECEHFLECVRTRRRPRTDGREGLRVLRVLELGQRSLMSADGAES